MDSREARKILALYRPGESNSNPRMAEALELARRDRQLAVWFGQHCAAHIQLPSESEAAPKVAAPEVKEAENAAADQIIPLNKPALTMIGIASLIALAVVLRSLLVPQPKNHLDSYRERMARLVQRSYPMKVILSDQTQVRQYFRTNGGAYEFSLPHNLEKLPVAGAAVFTWHSQPVSLFGMEAGVNTNLYIFLIKKSVFPDDTITAQPTFNRVGRVMTASWLGGNNVYLLTGPNDEAVLLNFLAASP